MAAPTRRIERLTPEQEAILPRFREEWLRIGTCTEPADRPRAEAAVCAMYAAIGAQRPQFVWCESPATALLAIAALKGGTLGDSLRDSLGASLGDSLRASLWASLRASLRVSLWVSLRASLGDSLRASLGDSLRDSLRDSLGDSLGASLGDCYWGQQEGHWIAFYRFCERHLNVDYEPKRREQLNWWAEIAQAACWWWPSRNAVVMCERPDVVQMEPWPADPTRRRLHCEDGPAIHFRDGYAVYAMHGVRVPERVVMAPETLSVQEITGERNAEVRRVMLDRFGAERYLMGTGAKPVHQDDYGTLYRADLPDDEPLCMVRVVNSTPEPDGSSRTYWLRVPPTMRRAREAVAWTFSLREEEYVLADRS